jgi:AraC-like DNA-binding protein
VQAAKKALAESEPTAHPASQVIPYISANLTHGDVKIATAAGAIGLSPRQLRRQLAQANTTFRDLLYETRKSMAAHYINETALSMTEIAFLLGFSELSAFSRAAKKWFGRTPRELRRRSRR